MAVNKVNAAKHPISIYIEYLKQNKLVDINSTFSFKKYIYKKTEFKDEYKEYGVTLSHINLDWLRDEINSLSPIEELAINSTIKTNHKKIYLPLVDLSPRDITNKASHDVINKLLDYWKMDFFVFDSGRSFHLYGTKPFHTKSNWLKFTASLLLLNEPGKQILIDTRWVGHRLMAGFSSLRLSNNTDQYKRYPLFIGMLSELSGKDNLTKT